eukprot:6656626-Prorocentrum_lima.AAC.1
MTSSLVGSEMCIRDSSWPRHDALSLPRAIEAERPNMSTTLFMKPRPMMSVSYTHLTLPTICSV